MAVAPQIIAALKRLNPTAPAGVEQYVPRDGRDGSRGWDQPERLEALISAGYPVRALLHGAIGVGKTTEILRWINGLQSTFLIAHVKVAGSQLSQLGAEYGGYGWGPDGALAQILREAVEDWQRSAGAWDPEEVDDPLANPWPLVGRLAQQRGKALLLLIDGTDLLPSDSLPLALTRIRNTLSDSVAGLVCVAPHAPLAANPEILHAAGYNYQWHLPAFPVVRRDGSRDVAVTAHLASGLAQRLVNLDVLEDPEFCFTEASYYSGGVPRDAIRILHSALLAAARVGKVNSYHLTMGLREVRQDLSQPLHPSDWLTLREVARTGNPMGARSLIAGNAILAYETEQDRYWRPHPLLEAMLDDPRLGGGLSP